MNPTLRQRLQAASRSLGEPEQLPPEAANPAAAPTDAASGAAGGTAAAGTAPTATSAPPDAAAASRMFGPRRTDGEVLSQVDALSTALHRRLIELLDLDALEKLSDEQQITARIRQAVTELLRNETVPLSQTEREQLVTDVVNEITGLGPIEPLFRDRTVSDILVNGCKNVYVERGGKLQRVPITFRNDAHLLSVIDRIVSRVGRRIDESSPMVDARLPDGSRVNAIIPPLAVDGPVLSIRRFGATITPARLVELGTLTADMLALLSACVKARLNILVSGGTGTGKTTFLNALSSFIPATERVVTIEDAAELRLQQEHVVRLETRPPNAEGRGEVVTRDLVKNALRMRPDRIIVGEVRAAETLDMLQAMNTGHEGSLTTVHANSPRDALARLETMIQFSGVALPERAMHEQIASTINVIVQISRMSDGKRRVVSVTEVTGMEGEMIQLQEIYVFRRQGVLADGTVAGRFEASGVRPRFSERIELAGIELPPSLFLEAT